jgi:hypothetical protein
MAQKMEQTVEGKYLELFEQTLLFLPVGGFYTNEDIPQIGLLVPLIIGKGENVGRMILTPKAPIVSLHGRVADQHNRESDLEGHLAGQLMKELSE